MIDSGMIWQKIVRAVFAFVLVFAFAFTPVAASEIVIEEDLTEERYVLINKQQEKRTIEIVAWDGKLYPTFGDPFQSRVVPEVLTQWCERPKLFILFQQLKYCA